jgi:hypothetical protein
MIRGLEDSQLSVTLPLNDYEQENQKAHTKAAPLLKESVVN